MDLNSPGFLLVVCLVFNLFFYCGAKQVSPILSLEYSGNACEGTRFDYTCPNGYNIRVTRAFFGRQDNVTCVQGTPDTDETQFCSLPDVLENVELTCNAGLSRCSVLARADSFGSNSSCDNSTSKYFSTTFLCEASLRTTSLNCLLNQQKKISCKAGEVLVITDAVIENGDDTGSGCADQDMCLANNVTATFKSECDLQRSCDLDVQSATVASLCEGEDREIHLSYICQECRNAHGSDVDCAKWTAEGECEKNPDWMIPYCRKACWRCDSSECRNYVSDANCEGWADVGECARNTFWMHVQCQKSCYKCDRPKETIGVTLLGDNFPTWKQYPNIAQGSKKVYLIDRPFGERGMLVGYLVHFRNTRPVRLQVWRPLVADPGSYYLIGESNYTPTDDQIAARSLVMLENNNCLLVGPDDVIGIMNEDISGPIGYNFAESGVTSYFYSFNDTFPQIGDEVTFDQLGLPFDFGLTAVLDTDMTWYANNNYACDNPGITLPLPPTTIAPSTVSFTSEAVTTDWFTTLSPFGPPGYKGIKGDDGDAGPQGPPGATGVKGENGNEGLPGFRGAKGGQGSKGATGERGQDGIPGTRAGRKGEAGGRGERGERGEPGPAGGTIGEPNQPQAQAQISNKQQESEECQCHDVFHNPYLILGFIIWTTVVTWVAVIVAICIIHSWRKSSSTRPDVGTGSMDPAWINAMKTEEYHTYPQDTIQR